jgi:hypothetical protein
VCFPNIYIKEEKGKGNGFGSTIIYDAAKASVGH